MWIVSDEAMREILGGEYCQVVLAKQKDKDISVRQLYPFQFNYFSYNGFRKFYNKTLNKIINDIKFINDDDFLAPVIKRLVK